MHAIIYCEQNLLFAHPGHLCCDRTTYDNIAKWSRGPFMFDIIGPAGPLMYLDQISRDTGHQYLLKRMRAGGLLGHYRTIARAQLILSHLILINCQISCKKLLNSVLLLLLQL